MSLSVLVEREVHLERIPDRVRWFFQNLLPGYGYRKLFVRMAIAQGRYFDMSRHLAELWYAQPAEFEVKRRRQPRSGAA